jgi:hypothetical protein
MVLHQLLHFHQRIQLNSQHSNFSSNVVPRPLLQILFVLALMLVSEFYPNIINDLK